ncbi:MAG: leucyl aminopeptidase [Myxococcales bacterium]|nr:leucyl aminopeptidase [Myxococcales bacterium]
MKIELKGGSATQSTTDVLVVGAYTSKPRPEPKGKKKAVPGKAAEAETAHPFAPDATLEAIDTALGGALVAQARREEFTGKANSTLVIAGQGRIAARTVLVVGLGEHKKHAAAPVLRTFGARGTRLANAERATSITVVAPESSPAALRAIAEGLVLGAWRFTKYLTGDRQPKAEIATATIHAESANAEGKKAVELGRAIGEAVCLTRDLVMEPPNVLHAPELANRAATMAKKSGLKVQVFDKAEITRRKMGLLLAVNQGSTIEPRFIHMTYTPKGKKPGKRLVFIGKGLTFDSGGLCIKPADGMLDMKIDMSGGANIVGLMAAVAALQPNVEVHGIIAATDNMPDGNAYRPGDVFTSYDGRSVEIINTDAEGRLVLADALAYARALEPDLVVDNATLTGACMVALGLTTSGFYANRDKLAEEFSDACAEAGESMWRMPLLEDLRDLLKSEVADMKHMGTRYGGSITAALFLREFVNDLPWIHCDIAGPVMSDKPNGFYNKGATGHGVLTFLRLVEKWAEKK